MTDRPIIFSGPMVRAMLEGRKTMTRRLLKNQKPKVREGGAIMEAGGGVMDYVETEYDFGKLPYAKGDRLYVRENWRPSDMAPAQTIYQADVRPEAIGPWTPSIHMPRARSRITLTVESVKVERLQDISEADAKAEGILEWPYTDVDGDPRLDGRAYMCMGYHWEHQKSEWDGFSSAKGAFEALWQSLNAKRAPWDSNPWVVAISFRVEKINIDRMPNDQT